MDFVRPCSAHSAHLADPTRYLNLVRVKGGLEVLNIVAALKSAPTVLARSLDPVSGGAQRIKVSLLDPVQVDGVVNVAGRINLVSPNAAARLVAD
jgi:hypothetical protein